MNAADVISSLTLPASTHVERRVPKKLLLENGAPTTADKRLINDGIEELFWVAALKPTTIGVPKYHDAEREYLEIAVLSLILRAQAKMGRLVELVHRAIPYPIFLIQSHPGGLFLSLAHLRWSQVHSGQTILAGPLITTTMDTDNDTAVEFLASLNIASQPRESLFTLYQGWIERFEAHNAARLSGSYTIAPNAASAECRRTALAEYERLSAEVTRLRARAGKETQLNRRVELNLQLKQLESRLAEAATHF